MPKGKFTLEDKGDMTELSYTYLGKTQIVKSYDNSVTWNPDIYEISDFKNVMGFDGVFLSERYENRHWSAGNYYADMNGTFLNIAESFGSSDQNSDTVIDIDGDGKSELICNCVYGGDGAQVCYIYKMTDEGVMRASGHDLMGDELLKIQVVSGNTSSEYLSEKNKMLCRYTDENGEFVTKEFDIDTDKLDFEIYHAEEASPADE